MADNSQGAAVDCWTDAESVAHIQHIEGGSVSALRITLTQDTSAHISTLRNEPPKNASFSHRWTTLVRSREGRKSISAMDDT